MRNTYGVWAAARDWNVEILDGGTAAERLALVEVVDEPLVLLLGSVEVGMVIGLEGTLGELIEIRDLVTAALERIAPACDAAPDLCGAAAGEACDPYCPSEASDRYCTDEG
ncbi:MAG: hypothetical protein ACRDQ0_10090 [Pseudonocardia sp.]